MADLKTSIILDLIDRVSAPARKVTQSLKKIGVSQGQLDAVSKAAGRVGTNLGNVGRETGRLAGKMAILGGAGLWFVKSQLIDTAAQFEKFRTVLETVEGSSAKAQASMDWVSDFAAKTPYELEEVMEGFVRLRAYGLDPTAGLLRSLGDTASAMGKPIMQAVEAIADAITGENERLKEFGIRAEVDGNQIRYSYTDRAGKQLFKLVDKNNRRMIQSSLEAIWNEKYAGAMEKQSQTWTGMISNLSDQWTRFKVKIMEAGLFDWLKDKLGGLLSTLDRMAADGSLAKLANDIGVKLKEGFLAAWKAGEAFWKILQTLGRVVSWLAGVMGGYENLAMAVAVLMGGKLLLSVVSLGASFFALGKAAIPAAAAALKGLLPLLSSAVASSASLLPLLGKAGLVGGAAAAGYGVGTLLNKGIGKGMGWLTDGKYQGKGAIGEWFYDVLNPEAGAAAAPASGDKPVRAGLLSSSRPDLSRQGAARAEVGGTIRLEIEGAPVKVKDVRRYGRGNVDFEVDNGRVLQGAG